MNSFPTNNFTSPDHTNHPSLPFTPRQLGSLDEEAPSFINDLFSNDLPDFGGFNVDTRAAPTPRVPPHGASALPHVKPLVHRRLINIHRRRHDRPGATPKRPPSRSASFYAHPQAHIFASAAPQPPIDPFDGAYTLNTYPSASLSAGPSATMFDGDVPRCHVGSDMLVPQASPQLPRSNTHATLAPQPTVDVLNNSSHAITHPSASCPSGSSSAAFENGEIEQLSFSGIQNIPSIPMTPGPLVPSSSLTWMTPIIPTSDSNPVIRPWDADTTSVGPATIPVPTSAAPGPARTEPPQVPASRCTCCKRVRPLVRDNIEWVRPDLMKMVLYFDWSSNAEAEAHESWEP